MHAQNKRQRLSTEKRALEGARRPSAGTAACLSTSQFGFRRGHSCSDLLLSVVDDWLSARDSKLCTAVVFLDLTKAFDNVDHQSLLLLLQKCEIGGTVLSWIKNFS